MLTILLIEPHTALRQSLRLWLEADSMSCTILEAPDLAHAVALAAAQPPRVIVLDLDALPPAELGDIQRLGRLYPTAAIVGIGLDDTPAHCQRARQSGITTFVPKSQLPTDLTPILRLRLQGLEEEGNKGRRGEGNKEIRT